MIDLVLMLLSSDWFLPYWNEIGLNVEGDQRDSIQRGCREILDQFIDKDASYIDSDFRPRRLEETTKRLELLLEQTAGLSLSKLDWSGDPGDDLSTGIMLQALNDLAKGHLDVFLGWEIRKLANNTLADIDCEDSELGSSLVTSDTTWDRTLVSLFPEDPDGLQNLAESIIRKRRLKVLWNRLGETLAKEQKEQLLDWYRQTCAKRGIPAQAVPSFIS